MDYNESIRRFSNLFTEDSEDLTESVNLKNAYKWTRRAEGGFWNHVYKFKNSAGDVIEVDLDKSDRSEDTNKNFKKTLSDETGLDFTDGDFWTLIFEVQGKGIILTGSGDARRVMTTIAAITLDYIDFRLSKKKWIIESSASREDKESSTAGSSKRARLYAKLFNVVAKTVPEGKDLASIVGIRGESDFEDDMWIYDTKNFS